VAHNSLYADEMIFARDTRYQRIVLTKWKDDLRLFLSAHLQFSSRDEYRYHAALVHTGLAAIPGARRVLVSGGGDGLAVREILKYPGVESITHWSVNYACRDDYGAQARDTSAWAGVHYFWSVTYGRIKWCVRFCAKASASA
jgi:spermidine synthase